MKTEKWNKPADESTIMKTIEALKKNGISADFGRTRGEVKEKVFALIPSGAEVMNNTSVTLDELGISKEIMESGRYDSVKAKLKSMNRKTQSREMQKLGAAPEIAIGSVHAVTENGEILIASGTGSQLAGYVYGADKVIFVVGTQKIVKNIEKGMKRIYEHSLPLENERAKKVYGSGSNVSKILIINKDLKPGRINLVFVNEAIGF